MTTQGGNDSQAADSTPQPGVLEGVPTEFDADGVPLLTEELFDLGKSAAIAIALWDRWAHRKVESLDLLSGERARRRISVDCTPPVIPWTESGIFDEEVDRACLVPLSLIRKAPLKSLGVTDDAGRSVPILGRRANGLVAGASLAFWISVDGSDDGSLDGALERVQPHWPDIYAIVTAEPNEARQHAVALIQRLDLRPTPARLVRDLAEMFLLVAVIPAESAQRRQVLKYSYHWELGPAHGVLSRIPPAFGWKPLRLQLEVGALRTAASYHLECAVPEGLTAVRISLPESRGTAPTTPERTKVAHVSGRYTIADDGGDIEAWISFLPDHNKLLPRIMWSGAAVAVIFAALLLAPGLREAMNTNQDPATAILLFIPAFLVGLNARSSENVVVGGLLLPLRIYALCLAGFVFVGGAMLVLKLWPAVTTGWLWAGLLLALFGALGGFVGWIPQVVASRRYHGHHEPQERQSR